MLRASRLAAKFYAVSRSTELLGCLCAFAFERVNNSFLLTAEKVPSQLEYLRPLLDLRGDENKRHRQRPIGEHSARQDKLERLVLLWSSRRPA